MRHTTALAKEDSNRGPSIESIRRQNRCAVQHLDGYRRRVTHTHLAMRKSQPSSGKSDLRLHLVLNSNKRSSREHGVQSTDALFDVHVAGQASVFSSSCLSGGRQASIGTADTNRLSEDDRRGVAILLGSFETRNRRQLAIEAELLPRSSSI